MTRRRLTLLPLATTLLAVLGHTLPARADECAYVKWTDPLLIVYVGESGRPNGGVDGYEYTKEGRQRPENKQGASWDCKVCVPLRTQDEPPDPFSRGNGVDQVLNDLELEALLQCAPPPIGPVV